MAPCLLISQRPEKVVVTVIGGTVVVCSRKLLQSLRAIDGKLAPRCVPVTARAQLSALQAAMDVLTKPLKASKYKRSDLIVVKL